MQLVNKLVQVFFAMILILVLGTRSVMAQTGGDQNRIITFSGTHITLGKAMAEIQNQSSYKFAFDPGKIETSQPVRLTSNRLTVAEALGQMFNQNSFDCVVRKRFIVVNPRAEVVERANVVAREMDKRPLTNDRYQKNDPDSLTAQPLSREYEIERIVTYIEPEPVVRNYPESYSAYEPIENYNRVETSLPRFAVKANLLYTAAALTPNLSAEIGLTPKSTLELSGSYSSRGRLSEAIEDHRQTAHWITRAEYRHWSCERFNGHYFGAHALYSRYYISGTKVPLLFDKEFSYNGQAVGAGLTYGYHLPLSKRWGLEFNVGLGYAYMWYDKGSCSKCEPMAKSETKHYFGPTRAGINIVFLIK